MGWGVRFFKKKNSDSHSRRSTRLWLLRMRNYALITAALGLGAGSGYIGYENNFFKSYAERIAVNLLDRTANAGFKVNDILVTGRKEIAVDDILSRLSIMRDQPIFGIDIAAAEDSLSAIPWVKSVTISRRLPDTILVALDERTPAALWQYQKKLSLIDSEGAVLTTQNLDTWKDLPLVVGDGAEKHVATLLGMLNAEPAVAANLVSAVRIGDRRWDLRLKNNITIRLPDTDMEFALRRLAVLDQEKNIFGRDISAIDLRQPERVIVTPGTTTAATTIKKNI